MRKEHHFHTFLKKCFSHHLGSIYTEKSIRASTKLKKVLDIFIDQEEACDFDDRSFDKWQSFFNKEKFSFWKEKIKFFKKPSPGELMFTDMFLVFKQIFIQPKFAVKVAVIIFVCAISVGVFVVLYPQTSKNVVAKIDSIVLKPFFFISEASQTKNPQATAAKKNIRPTPLQLSEFIRKNQFKLNEKNISENGLILSTQDIFGLPAKAKNY